MPTAHGTKSVLGGPTYSIGAAKAVTSIAQQPNGTYTIAYVVVIRNYGASTLYNVQVTDDLVSTFPNPATFTISVAPVASGSLAANASFNGNSNVNLLTSATSTLAPGSQETITFIVNVDTQGSVGTFYNTALASGGDINGGTVVADSSDWGTNPDPDGDQNPNEGSENNPTPTPLSGNTITTVGAAKTIIDTSVVDCIYSITYQVTVRNLGNEGLDNIQVLDNLDLAFPAPAIYTVTGISDALGNGLTANANFGTAGDFSLLDAANSSLGFGETGFIRFTVNLNINGKPATFSNSAVATATGAVTNNTTTDVSDWGTNPDPDLDGFPNEPAQGEDDPTPFTVQGPIIGIAKEAGTPQIQPDGSYIVNYNIYVRNIGTGEAQDVQVYDQLNTTFPAPANATLVSGSLTTTSGGFLLNTGTYAQGSWYLLNAGSVLAAGATEVISFSVKVDLNNTTDTLFNNSAFGFAYGDCNYTADTSNVGNNADPSGSIPTPVVLLQTDTKIPSGFSPNGDGTNDNFVISNIAGKKVDIQIINRWGSVVYKNANYDNSWNGTANTGFGLGEDLPTGTYWYIITIDDGSDVKDYANYLTLTR
jgi:gliding motility-associated-like protein/uncharacterized repeat protein (TIGR01451 family)